MSKSVLLLVFSFMFVSTAFSDNFQSQKFKQGFEIINNNRQPIQGLMQSNASGWIVAIYPGIDATNYFAASDNANLSLPR